jgi:medium-chain acyl-[acyl-carrier-protein] hydrolase
MMSRSRSASGKWLVSHPASGVPRVSLICFPPAGAGASAYAGWRNLLPPDVDLFAVQLPGRENRFGETPLRSCTEIVDQLAPVIDGLAVRPVVLLGHSMGALLAFEVARWFQQQGRCAPALLITAGRAAPHLPPKLPRMHTLPDAKLIAQLKKLGGSPVSALDDPELASLLLPALRADLTVAETHGYRAPDPLNMPLLALSGRSDPLCRPADVEAWSRHTTMGFAHRCFAGGHFFIHEHEAEVVATVVSEIRLRVESPTSRGWHGRNAAIGGTSHQSGVASGPSSARIRMNSPGARE